jgi:hypothetical protein
VYTVDARPGQCSGDVLFCGSRATTGRVGELCLERGDKRRLRRIGKVSGTHGQSFSSQARVSRILIAPSDDNQRSDIRCCSHQRLTPRRHDLTWFPSAPAETLQMTLWLGTSSSQARLRPPSSVVTQQRNSIPGGG